MEQLKLNLERQTAAIDIIVGTEGKVEDVSSIILRDLSNGHESIFKGLSELVGFDTNDKIDKELISAYAEFNKKIDEKRPEVLLHKEITTPVGMLNTYNSLVKMLTSMEPFAVKAYEAIVEYDAAISKSIANSDYRESFLRTDGDFNKLIKGLENMKKLKHEELNGDESSMLVMYAFANLSTIGLLVSDLTKNKLPLDYDILNDITNNIADKTSILEDKVANTPSSVEYLKSLSTITNVTANAVTLLTGLVYSIEITKRALTKALIEMT